MFGDGTGLFAAALFCMLPPILGHAGQATLDLALAATLALALLTFTLWLEQPSLKHSLLLGLGAGLAVLSKFTALLFLTACGGAALLCWLLASEIPIPQRAEEFKPRLKTILVSVALFAAMVLVCYRFSYHPLVVVTPALQSLGSHVWGSWSQARFGVLRCGEDSRPRSRIFPRIKQVKGRLDFETKMYLLGHVQTTGWWYFYPVAIAVKTPIAFLILLVVGAFANRIGKWARNRGNWQVLVPLAAAAALLLICLPTKLNIGLRYILPIYPLLSILAGLGVTALWQAKKFRWLGRGLPPAFWCGWQFRPHASTPTTWLISMNSPTIIRNTSS